MPDMPSCRKDPSLLAISSRSPSIEDMPDMPERTDGFDDSQLQPFLSSCLLDVEELPLEVAPEILQQETLHLVAHFPHAEKPADADDVFNDLGWKISRDNENRVATMEEAIEKVNQYDYDLHPWTPCIYSMKVLLTGGIYMKMSAQNIPAGYFGHYISARRHMLVGAGEHNLQGVDYWEAMEPINDESNLVRTFGIKILLTVPENHIAGCFRVGGRSKSGAEEDGEYVLLGQGRHVLSTDFYRNIEVKKLEDDQVKLGPITVLYIKEGSIGGAYHRKSGKFETFHAGPPYILHEKEYEQIQHVKRTIAQFRVGPITFITVKDGQLAGAYHKSTGKYQILPPGQSYQLHNKDFEGIELKSRTNSFKLGPFSFVTVQKGWLAGAYKKRGGDFILFPPGSTYMLNEDVFDDPVLEQRNRHVVKIGPLTFLTLEDGTLSGAYRTDDGRFEEFGAVLSPSARAQEFVLHDRDYHGLTVIKKYSDEVQDFGPNKVVTVPEGLCGVFEREGLLEIKAAGFYKVDASCRILAPISMRVGSEHFKKLEFRTKDSVRLIFSSIVVWNVEDPLKVAKWPGTQDELRDSLRAKAEAAMVMNFRCYTRAELMPTRQDVMLSEDDQQDADGNGTDPAAVEASMKLASIAAQERIQATEASTTELLNTASESGSWGVGIVSVKIDTLELGDDAILSDLDQIAQQQLKMRRTQVEGGAAVAQANLERGAAIQRAAAESEIKLTTAVANSNIVKAKAQADADVKLAQAKAANEVALLQATSTARAEAEAKKISLEMQRQMAQSQADIKETRLRAKQAAANAAAAATTAMAEAEYQKGIKEQDVRSRMPEQDLELEKMKLVVKGVKSYGQAAWRHPEEMQSFYEQMRPFLQLSGPPGPSSPKSGPASPSASPSGKRVSRANSGWSEV